MRWYIFAYLGNGDYKQIVAENDEEKARVCQALRNDSVHHVIVQVSKVDEWEYVEEEIKVISLEDLRDSVERIAFSQAPKGWTGVGATSITHPEDDGS